MNTPVATTLPMALPEIMPKREDAITATLPEPPVKRPVKRWPMRMKVSAPPVPERIAPKMPNMASMVALRPSMVPQMPRVLW